MLALARPELVEKPLLRNYLRARGEYLMVAKLTGGAWELPPRTRRIRPRLFARPIAYGTTSAHAENTPPQSPLSASKRNYLRARREYFFRTHRREKNAELPPRTRRILKDCDDLGVRHGTTSAHAENTGHRGSQSCSKRNYLRARGEYFSRIVEDWDRTELPPRTRRILPCANMAAVATGTTSAHAENTL